MTDAPIAMSGPMVLAIIREIAHPGTGKSETRRLAWRPATRQIGVLTDPKDREAPPSRWQSAKPGDRLWVRESWRADDLAKDDPARTIYQADAPADVLRETRGIIKWRNSRYMPRERSRLTLIVVRTKIEPPLNISEEDARAEGFAPGQLNDGFGPRDIGGGYTIESPGTYCSAGGMFQETWAKLHPDWDGYSSPDVVAIRFKPHLVNIDQMKAEAA